MHRRGQERQLFQSPSRTSAPPTSSQRAPRALFAVIGLLGIAVVGGAGCGDEDTTDVVPVGGSGGSAGSAGSAGSGGTAGSAGSAGTAGTAGTGGTGDPVDAGSDADSDSGAITYDRTAIATAICAHMADVPDCSAPPGCVDNFLGAQSQADFMPAACTDEILGFYACLAAQDENSFTCNEIPGEDGGVSRIADISYFIANGSNGCPAEEEAFLSVGDGTNCPAD